MMKRVQKIELISQIGRELQSRMTYGEIDTFLSEFKVDVKKKSTSGSNSKWVYSKEVLAGEPDETILNIADELGIEHDYVVQDVKDTDFTFWREGHFRLFLSHLATFRENTHHLKMSLNKFAISSFVAHDEIQPTKEWQVEIEKALFSMDALAAILMPGFNESKWTDQEMGVAIGLNKLVIPIRKGLDPYGFIGKYQGFNSNGKNIESVARGIAEILATHKMTKHKLIECLAGAICSSTSAAEIGSHLLAIELLDSVAKDILVKVVDRYESSATIVKEAVLRKRLEDLFLKHGVAKTGQEDGQSWTEDDIPF